MQCTGSQLLTVSNSSAELVTANIWNQCSGTGCKAASCMPASLVGADSSPDCPNSDPLPAKLPGRAAEGDLSAWIPAPLWET